MGNRATKLAMLHAQVKVRDKLIGGLLKVIAENKISLPQYLIFAIDVLYYNKKDFKNGNKQPGYDSIN